jgi:hypothetical protein
MRWLILGIVLLIALVVAIAVLIGEEGKESKRPPRVRPAEPPALVVPPVP